MATTVTLLKIYTGAATLDLMDNTKYRLRRGWDSKVAVLRAEDMGGVGPYDDVEEDFKIDVVGTSPADAMANYEALQLAFVQAEQWWYENDSNVLPVLLQYQPNGSAVANGPLQGVILGPIQQGRPCVIPPPTFNEVGLLNEIKGVVLRFLWRAPLMAASETSTTSSAAANPTVQTVTFATAANAISPHTLEWSGFNNTTTLGTFRGFAVVASSSNSIQIVEAESAPSHDQWLRNSGLPAPLATQQARGGDFLCFYSPGVGGAAEESDSVAIPTTLKTKQHIGVLACVRNGNASTSYQLAVRSWTNSTGFSSATGGSVQTPYVSIDGSDLTPHLVYLGTLDNKAGHKSFELLGIGSRGSTGASDCLAVDYLVFFDADDAQVVGIDQNIALNFAFQAGSTNVVVFIEDRMLAEQGPAVGMRDTAATIYVYSTYRGDPAIFLKGDTVAACFCITTGAYFRYVNATPTAISLQLTAKRHKAYVTPQ